MNFWLFSLYFYDFCSFTCNVTNCSRWFCMKLIHDTLFQIDWSVESESYSSVSSSLILMFKFCSSGSIQTECQNQLTFEMIEFVYYLRAHAAVCCWQIDDNKIERSSGFVHGNFFGFTVWRQRLELSFINTVFFFLLSYVLFVWSLRTFTVHVSVSLYRYAVCWCRRVAGLT